MYIWLFQRYLEQNLIQHCKAIIHQLKKIEVPVKIEAVA